MIYKQSNETINSSIDFSPGLSSGEMITSIATVSIAPNDTLVVSQYTINSNNSSVTLNISGGTISSTYSIAVTIVTNSGQILTCTEIVSVIQVRVSPAWSSTMVTVLRHMLGDTSTNPQYSDVSLASMIVVAGVMTTRELDFKLNYIIDINNVTISPDPVTSLDHDFMGLVCLKAASFIADGEYRNAAKMSISHRDGPQHIDTKGIAENLKVVAKSRLDAYEDAKLHYEIGDGTIGKAILGPYSVFTSSYNSHISPLNAGAMRSDMGGVGY